MHSTRLAARRSRAQAGLLSTVGAVALVLTALVVGLIGYLDFSGTVSTRELVAHSDATARSIRVETELGSDPAAQNARAMKVFDSEFSGVPITVTRTLADYPLPVTHDGTQLTLDTGDEARITPATDPQLQQNAALVDGQWADASSGGGSAGSPASGVLQADAAQQLNLHVGDVLVLGTGSDAKSITIVGTWRPKDAKDSRWFSEQGVATGNATAAGDGTASFGPLMIDETLIPSLGPTPSVRWTLALDAQELTPDELDHAGLAATSLLARLTAERSLTNGEITVDGTVAHTAAAVHANLESVRGVTPVGTLLVVLIGIITLVQLARLLSLARRPENALLRSRGASAAWLTSAGVSEAAVIAFLSCGVGFVVAAIALGVTFGASAVPFAPWEFAMLAALVVLVTFGTAAFLDSIRLAKRDAIDDSGRARTAATLGTTTLALAAAGVAVWQSLLYGSPLVTDASGRISVNPLAVVAPTLALIAFALLLLLMFGPLAASFQRIAARRRRLQPSYSARQVARGLGSYAVAVLVVTLSVGGLVVASAYSGSWRTLSEHNAELITGADARVMLNNSDFPKAGSTLTAGSEFLTIPGVTAAAPVFSTPISIGDSDTGRITALPQSAMESVVTNAGGALDVKALARALNAPDSTGVALPEGTTSISLSADVGPADFAPLHGRTPAGWAQSSVWLHDADGTLITASFPRVDLSELGSGSSLNQVLHVDLPLTEKQWWLTGIDFLVHVDDGYFAVHYSSLDATTSSGTTHVAFDTTKWGATTMNSLGFSSENGVDGLTMGLPSRGSLTSSLRFVDLGGTSSQLTGTGVNGSSFFPPQPLPIVVSQELADHYDVKKGDAFALRFAGSGLTINGKISAISPLLPGMQSRYGVLADLAAFNNYILSSSPVVPGANQVWVATSSPGALVSALPKLSALQKGVSIVTPSTAVSNSFAAPAELALWTAAIGCLLLAVISLGAVALTVARARRGEVAVLRAVGISAKQQSRARLFELASIVLVSAIFGIVAGSTVSVLTVPNLAHSAVESVPAGLHAALEFAYAAGGALLLGTLGVLLGIAAVSALLVRRSALDTSERLETR